MDKGVSPRDRIPAFPQRLLADRAAEGPDELIARLQSGGVGTARQIRRRRFAGTVSSVTFTPGKLGSAIRQSIRPQR